jgi:leucyl-tRNA synthetase
MELVNELYAFSEKTIGGPGGRRLETADTVGVVERAATIAVLKEAVEALVLMLSPFAPHMAEELWERLGHAGGLAQASWPSFDPEVARAELLVIPVQVNGKLRSRLTVPHDVSDQTLRELALADAAVRAHTSGRPVKNVVIAKGRLVNVVVG